MHKQSLPAICNASTVTWLTSRDRIQVDNGSKTAGRAVGNMHDSQGNYQPECAVAHDLINRLSAIIGHCDLLAGSTPPDSPSLERVLLIRHLAKLMAKDLGRFQCDLARLRETKHQKSVTS